MTGPARATPRGRKAGGKGWDYLHLAADDHSRLAYGAIFPDETRKSCLTLLFNAPRFCRSHSVKVCQVMTDNGASFRSRRQAKALRILGIKHKRTKPYTPRTHRQGRAVRPDRMARLGLCPAPIPLQTNAATPSTPSSSTTTPIAPIADAKPKPQCQGYPATTWRDMTGRANGIRPQPRRTPHSPARQQPQQNPLHSAHRSVKARHIGCGSSVAEHTLGKGEVESSILSHSTINPHTIR